MNGLKFAASGLVGRAPTISGYSCGGFALSIVDMCEELREWTRAQARDSAIYWDWICKSQFLDPAGDFALFSASNERSDIAPTWAKNSLYAASSSESSSRWCSPRRMCTSGLRPVSHFQH